MSSVRPGNAEPHHGVGNSVLNSVPQSVPQSGPIAPTTITTSISTRERLLPVSILIKLTIAAGIGVGEHFTLDEIGSAVSLGLIAYLVMDQVTRQLR
ncbi:hypothetical protein JMF97_04075 [Micromonospora fiedleri]|uniref:Uncharacterized protein n=1 Tax=Micromonospora fiedleri TaxID=1157498 RepID=A0ABS1UG84_9ACTN|nr:hypothetical protein [Micromonospora fiedleri]